MRIKVTETSDLFLRGDDFLEGNLPLLKLIANGCLVELGKGKFSLQLSEPLNNRQPSPLF